MTHPSIDWARFEAQRLVLPLGRRWQHVRAVAASAERVALTAALDRGILVSAAWLHDIGYADQLRTTGFHPLDGARYLLTQGFDERVAALVAHHSCAVAEARLRGLYSQVREFPDEQGAVRDALWFCDLTTGPDGMAVSVSDRLAEIQQRYGQDHVVTQFVDVARTELLGAVERTEALLASTESHPR